MALAAKFFEAALHDRAGAKARGYLADRGLDAAGAARVSARLSRRPTDSPCATRWRPRGSAPTR